MTASKTQRNLTLALTALAVLASAVPAAAAEWQDSAIGYRWGYGFKEPGVVDRDGKAKDVAKSIFSFTHADGWKYGGNFLSFDYLVSTSADPGTGGTSGASEFYLVHRTDFSLNEISGSKAFAFGPVRDVSIETGIDLNTKNTQFGSGKVMPVLGPVIAFDVPGFLNVGLLAAREWNRNGFAGGKAVVFKTTGIVATSWGIPLGTHASFAGFANVVLPKGKDAFGTQTKTELLLHPKVLVDVGSFWGWNRAVEAGVGYEYWYNKFGNDHAKLKGCIASTPFVEVAAHL